MADSFMYKNRKGGYEQRPMQPNFFQKAYENAAYPADIDKQRANAQAAANVSSTPDALPTQGTAGSADDR